MWCDRFWFLLCGKLKQENHQKCDKSFTARRHINFPLPHTRCLRSISVLGFIFIPKMLRTNETEAMRFTTHFSTTNNANSGASGPLNSITIPAPDSSMVMDQTSERNFAAQNSASIMVPVHEESPTKVSLVSEKSRASEIETDPAAGTQSDDDAAELERLARILEERNKKQPSSRFSSKEMASDAKHSHADA